MAITHQNCKKKCLTVGAVWLLGLACCWLSPTASIGLDCVDAQSTSSAAPAGGAALLSVLDPGAIDQPVSPVAYQTELATGPTTPHYPVHPAGLQESGIIETSPIPNRSTTFPYTLTARQRTTVRSGPSKSSYPTDYLTAGESVEVYRHDPEGWLAIRPPEGSFSLIKGNQARPTSQPGVYQVTIDRARAWVGTRVDQSHQPLAQVRLKQGELIAVQSSLEVQEDNSEATWLQIDPPAGEFRWVHQSAFGIPVEGESEVELAAPATANASGQSSLSTSAGTVAATEVAPLELATDDSTEKQDQWRAAQRDTPEIGYSEYLTASQSPEVNSLAGAQSPIGAFQNVSYGGATTAPRQNDADSAGQPQRQPDAAAQWDAAVRRLSQNEHGFYQASPETAAVGTTSTLPPTTVSNWNQQLNLLNQQLSQQILQPTEQWELASLLQQSEALLQAAPSAAQKDAAGAMQKRILGFLQLKQQKPGHNDLTAGLAGARFASNGTVFPAGSPNSTPIASASTSNSNGQTNPYAAVGYLKELILDRGRQPNSFVLQDIHGKTLCHISPMPGVQLHQSLDKKIGVKGRPGYHAQLRLPHVTVDSFDRLD